MIDKQRFTRDGIVFPIGQIDVSGYANLYDQFQSDSIRLRGKETYIKPHLVSGWLDEIVRLPAIIDMVADLIGPDIVLWESDWAVKRAGTGEYVPWHQDSPYWNLSTNDVVSVLLAVTDITVENGAMKVVIGSHRDGEVGALSVGGDVHQLYAEGERTTDEKCMFPFSHELGDVIDVDSATPVVLRAGELSVHSIHIVHGGEPNPSDSDRVMFGMRYISADTRCKSGVDSVTAIRGDCERGYFDLEPRADGEFTDGSLAALERALEFPSGFGEAKRLR